MENKPDQDKSGQDRNNAKPDRKQGTPTVSAVLSDGQLVEMVFDPIERRTRFVLWQDGVWHFEQIVRASAGERLIPYSAQNNLIKKEVVLFPTEPREYGSEEELVGDIRTFIHRYVDISPRFERIASYYVLFSWLYDGFDSQQTITIRKNKKGNWMHGATRFVEDRASYFYDYNF